MIGNPLARSVAGPWPSAWLVVADFFVIHSCNPLWQVAVVTDSEAIALLKSFREGKVQLDQVLNAFQTAPITDLGYARLDTHRGLRTGFPEVVFAQGKTESQLVGIVSELVSKEGRVLVTRVTATQAEAVLREFPQAVHYDLARCLTLETKPRPHRTGQAAVICAGTSDLPVAEEAALTVEMMGNPVTRIRDVGVAGIHRILDRMELIRSASVNIVVAGMEGALPSVVAGLVNRPVIAVPTSVGYGASFGGLAALLGMLNSCGSGVTVVNIDNGFGAGFAAGQIMSLHSAQPFAACDANAEGADFQKKES